MKRSSCFFYVGGVKRFSPLFFTRVSLCSKQGSKIFEILLTFANSEEHTDACNKDQMIFRVYNY